MRVHFDKRVLKGIVNKFLRARSEIATLVQTLRIFLNLLQRKHLKHNFEYAFDSSVFESCLSASFSSKEEHNVD